MGALPIEQENCRLQFHLPFWSRSGEDSSLDMCLLENRCSEQSDFKDSRTKTADQEDNKLLGPGWDDLTSHMTSHRLHQSHEKCFRSIVDNFVNQFYLISLSSSKNVISKRLLDT